MFPSSINPFCKYKDALGIPGKGAHFHIPYLNVAIVDILLTIVGAYIIYLLIPRVSFWMILIGLFLLGIILHRLFCVRTTVDKFLFY
jgi:hypothetical protein